ncbi:MAG TPA: D-alanine--D-alanine ligase [Alphaproteobacteria bacterium]|nr:D-alanine--D-alanine ligase [Alphaproteobacteria bacterium]
MNAARHVAVLKGGWSVERDVSLVSGEKCAEALRGLGYRVSEVDVDDSIANVLVTLKPDVVFNALHGRWGEDGCMQGLLELLRIPYTHSGVRASATAMDKPTAKRLFHDAGIACPEGRVMDRHALGDTHPMPPPYVVKPITEGSSAGVFIIRQGDNAPPAQIAAKDWAFGDAVLVERYIPGQELTVAVMGDRPLAVTAIVPNTKFYDYEAKYADGGSRHIIPAEVDAQVYQHAMNVALAAHQVLGCRGVSRADFRYDDSVAGRDGLYLLEINTQPGMTPTSLVPEQAAYLGISFGELCRWLVEDASCAR